MDNCFYRSIIRYRSVLQIDRNNPMSKRGEIRLLGLTGLLNGCN